MTEGTTFDKKSLLSFPADHRRWDWQKISKHCIAFANARGGVLHFGVEDSADAPAPTQRIPEDVPDRLRKGISHNCVNVAVATEVKTHVNGGEFLELLILASRQTIAGTTGGRYFIRVSDESKPVMPDELTRLVADKDAYVWEAQTTRRVPVAQADPVKKARFLAAIRASDRVSAFLREKTEPEMLEHYLMAREGCLTNLGILWIGRRDDRALLLHAPAIQFIKYDERGEKVFKREWTDFSLNPKELIEAVWNDIPDWRLTTEIREGLFPITIPHYDESVIRELLANALAHRPYTTRGDIFLNLHPEFLEVRNPGLLPLGVTPANILHTSVQRNRHLSQVFYDLKLMEREGSGYDKMYEVLLSRGRPAPLPREENDSVTVRVERRIVRPDVASLLEKTSQQYDLRQRERICLGLIAQHGLLKATDFARILDLPDDTRVRSWLGRLLPQQIVVFRGRTRATEYLVNPDLLRSLQQKGPTTLQKIAPHRLRYLIREDLETHSPDASTPSTPSALHRRIGLEISLTKIKRALHDLCRDGTITHNGKRGLGSAYFISAKVSQLTASH